LEDSVKKLAALSFAILLFVLSASAVRAQTPPEAPKPGPEEQKLAYFVGKWVAEAEMKPSAFGPGGNVNFTQTCEWFAGNFSLICHTEATMFGSVIKALSIMGYDVGDKTYVYFETNSVGQNTFSRGTVDGDIWTWAGDSKVNGKTMRSRFTLKRVTDDTATFKFEMGAGSDAMVVIMEGKQTRQK
jgi:Protein of unknown function (DUF1579)